MSSRTKILDALGYSLKTETKPAASYIMARRAGNFLYTAGCIPLEPGKDMLHPGHVGGDVSIEEAQESAKLCVANIFRAAYAELGDLDQIQSLIKLNGFINSAPGFTEQHIVMNAASDMMVEVLGMNAGQHARAAVGMAELPLNACVEIEAIFEVK